MAGVNKAIIVGNLGKDPEVKTFQNGGKICNLSIATSETWKDKATGERKERTEWHRVTIMNEALVRIAEQYLRKGSKVYIEGQIETRKYQAQDGTDRYATEIVLRPFNSTLTLLDGKSSGDSGGSSNSGYSGGSSNSGYSGGSGASGGNAQTNQSSGKPAPIDDDIPF